MDKIGMSGGVCLLTAIRLVHLPKGLRRAGNPQHATCPVGTFGGNRLFLHAESRPFSRSAIRPGGQDFKTETIYGIRGEVVDES